MTDSTPATAAPITVTRREREVLNAYRRANDAGQEWVGDERLPKGRYRIDAPPYPTVNSASLRRLHKLGLVEWREGYDGPGRITALGRDVLQACAVCGASGSTEKCTTATGRDHTARLRQMIDNV